MGLLALACWIVLASAVPDLAPRRFGIAAHAPDLFLALAVYLPLRGRGFSSVKWAILLGFAKDAHSLDPLGTHAFVLGTVAWVVARGVRTGVPCAGPGRLVRVAVASVLATWLLAFRLLPVTEVRMPLSAVFLDAFPIALWTALACGPLFPVLDRLRLFDDLAGRLRGLPA
jgi:cell shape-determining protein MreD